MACTRGTALALVGSVLLAATLLLQALVAASGWHGRPMPSGEGGLHMAEVQAPRARGLSDLAVDANGQLWAVSERQHSLWPLDLAAEPPRASGEPIPVVGLAKDVDIESFAWLGPDRLLLGTERPRRRSSDDLWLAHLAADGQSVQLDRAIALPYALWNLRAAGNEGIEALCAAQGVVVVAAETVGHGPGGARYAPVAVLPQAALSPCPAAAEGCRAAPDPLAWAPYRLRLTSATGKISALACRAGAGATAVELLAVERHFGVGRLLRFELSTQPPPPGLAPWVEPELVRDLGDELDALPNLEGLIWRADDSATLLSDNDFGLIHTPHYRLQIDSVRPRP